MKALCNALEIEEEGKEILEDFGFLGINASARINGTNYSKLISGLKTSGIIINRKMFAQLALIDPQCLKKY